MLAEELKGLKSRTAADVALTNYRNRRLVECAAVQGASRFASDIIIRGADTPAKIVDGRLENFNYAGIVTRLLPTDPPHLLHGPVQLPVRRVEERVCAM